MEENQVGYNSVLVEVSYIVLDLVIIGNSVDRRLEFLGVSHLCEEEGLNENTHIASCSGVDSLPVSIELCIEEEALVGDFSKIKSNHSSKVESWVSPPYVFNGCIHELSCEVVLKLDGVVHEAQSVSNTVSCI